MKDPHYRKLVDGYLHAWYKFVPRQSKMDSSNCWHVANFNPLPSSLAKKMKNMLNFEGLQKLFSKDEVQSILSRIFAYDDTTRFTTALTNHSFCLPNVNLIGFPKTGSSLFYNYYIEQHSLLARPRSKEGLFWLKLMQINDEQYQELAVLLYLYHYFRASQKIRDNPDMFTIDATVTTVFATAKPLSDIDKDACIVPLLISKTMPKIKLLILVRDPVNRLWSDFFYFCSPKRWDDLIGSEKSPFQAASLFHNYTVAAIEEFSRCIKSGHTQIYCATIAGSYAGLSKACQEIRLGVSMYYIHLLKWIRLFPREQLHVIRLEDLTSDASGTMGKVWTFLDVPPMAEITTASKKVRESGWSQLEGSAGFNMFPKTRKLLSEFFHPYNVRLAELLDDERYLWLHEG